jgi:serine protease DegQ
MPLRPSRFLSWLSAACAALLMVGVPGIGHAAMPPAIDGQAMPSLAPMLQRVTPAVVNISSKKHVQVQSPYFNDPAVRQLFGLPGGSSERVEQSLGSGVIVDAAKGYVLTNNHVVGGADDISVTLQDGRTFKGKRIGTDPDTDVAVVQIPADHLQALPLADSNQLRVGDYVVAVGNPFGLGQTVTSGIVSALGRSGFSSTGAAAGAGTGFQDFIQTDASINPGNSGGALVNLRGELVGINTMIFSPSGGNVGIGFAVPTAITSEVMEQLLAHGKVERGNLGLQTQAITPRIAQLLSLNDTNGVVVTGVSSGSAAERAGLQPGDVLTTLDGKPLRSVEDLRNTEGLLPLGTRVQLGVIRDGKSSIVDAVLSAQKSSTVNSVDGGQLDTRLAGVAFSDLSDSQRRMGMFGAAVVSVQPNSRGARAGLTTDDIVVGIGNQRIPSVSVLRGLANVHLRQLVLIVAHADGSNRYVVIN